MYKPCACVALLALVLPSTGCATYDRRPLTLATHATDWPERAIDLPEIAQYGERLAAQRDADEESAPFNTADGLTPHEAEAVALHFNPQLRVARAAANVPLASAKQAGWWPDPQFEAEVLRFIDRGRKSRFRFDGPSLDGVNTGLLGSNGISADGIEATRPGFRRTGGDYIEDPVIVGASLSFTIPLSGRLAVEKDLKWAEYNAAWRQIVIKEWQLLIRLRANWLEWSTMHERAALLSDFLTRLQSVADIAERLAAVGELSPTDARLLHIELARLQAERQSLDNKLDQKRLTLLALLGLAPDAPFKLQPEIRAARIESDPARRQTALLENHPRIQSVRADYEAAEQKLRLEIREQYPDLNIGPNFSFEEGFSRLGLGLGFPIPLWNRNRQAVAEAFAEREAARTRAEATVESVLGELALAEQRLTAASQRRTILTNEVAPLVDRQVDETRKLLDLGEIDVLVLREALTAALQTQEEILNATLAKSIAASAQEEQ